MAALQTLRNKPALLMSVIGGALLLFIVTLTDLNSCSNPNVMAEVNGEEITIQDFEQQVNNEISLEMALTGASSLSDERKEEIRRNLWDINKFNLLVAAEADKLGLVVTDEEVQNIFSTTLNSADFQQKLNMMQSQQMSPDMFTYAEKLVMLNNLSAEEYKNFMNTVDQQINQMKQQNPQAAEYLAIKKQACLYCESRIPAQLLTEKYGNLLQFGATTNPTTAKMLAQEYNLRYNLDMVRVPYNTVADKDIKVTDEELKAKYEELKENFRIAVPSRDLKIIDEVVVASTKDRENIMAQVKAAEDSLRKVQGIEATADMMRGLKTDQDYQNVYLPASAFADEFAFIASELEGMAVDSVSAMRLEPMNREGKQYVSTFKLIATKTTPDSMQVCVSTVGSKAIADSIVAAVKAGSTLSAEAQGRGLENDTVWTNVPFYYDIEGEDLSTPNYMNICQVPVGETAYLKNIDPYTGQELHTVVTILDAKAESKKYNVAIVRTAIEFSEETYKNRLNELRKFLDKNRSIAEIEENAPKAGFFIENRPNFTTGDIMTKRSEIGGEATKEAFLWAFDEAEAGNVSPKVYSCGRNNDHLLVVAVSAINEDEYLSWDNPTVKSELEALVRQDKKAEKLLGEAKNVKNIADAKKLKGAVSSAPVQPLSYYINSDPAFAGVLERTEKGKFTGAVKGANAIVFALVNDKSTMNAESNDFTNMNSFSSFFQANPSDIIKTLEEKAEISDMRYKF